MNTLPTNTLPFGVWDLVETRSDSVVVPLDAAADPLDRIYRLTTDQTTQTLNTQWCTTQEFSRGLVTWVAEKEREVDVLRNFCAWQKTKLDYQAVYNAYLLEAISEDEFAQEAEAFVVELKDPDPFVIGAAMDHLVALLPFEVSTSEFADFFHCEPKAVLEAIRSVSHEPKLHALLPLHPEFGESE